MTKKIKIIFAIIILIFAIPIKVQADGFTLDSIFKEGGIWLKKAETESKGMVDEGKITEIMLPIGQFLTAVGAFVLIGAILVLGIKYMMADANSKGKLKEKLIGVVIGGVVIFGAFEIWKIVYNFMDGLTK